MFADLLQSRLAGIVEVTAAQARVLQAHFELLSRWNRTVNLTRIESPEEAVTRHYGEALFLAARLPLGSLRIADVGSGAGFPGFPIAVVRADCEVTLIESHQRKAVFLKEASRSLPNVRVVARRAEEVSGAFDTVTSRAVSYEDLKSALENLAPTAYLLTGVEDPPEIGFVWESAIALPWGKQRFLRIGHVSRETAGT